MTFLSKSEGSTNYLLQRLHLVLNRLYIYKLYDAKAFIMLPFSVLYFIFSICFMNQLVKDRNLPLPPNRLFLFTYNRTKKKKLSGISLFNVYHSNLIALLQQIK